MLANTDNHFQRRRRVNVPSGRFRTVSRSSTKLYMRIKRLRQTTTPIWKTPSSGDYFDNAGAVNRQIVQRWSKSVKRYINFFNSSELAISDDFWIARCGGIRIRTSLCFGDLTLLITSGAPVLSDLTGTQPGLITRTILARSTAPDHRRCIWETGRILFSVLVGRILWFLVSRLRGLYAR